MLIQLFFILFIFLPSTYAYENPRGSVCDDSDTYTSNSTFSTNLDQALDNLKNTTAATGFNYTTTGNSTQQITGLALCRATINQSDCQACIDAATSGIQQACPGKKKAQVWYTLCMLRYSDVKFIHQPEDEVVYIIYNINDAPDPNDYNQRVALLMQNLSYSAGVSDKRYAVGQTRLESNQPLYGYVDCTRDISGQNCTNCLLDTVDAISSCCLDKWAVWLMTPTCNIQVSLDPSHSDWVNGPFIDTNSSIPPAPAPAPAPAGMLPLPPPSTIPSTKHSSNEVGRGNLIVIIISAAAAAIITVCLLVGVRFISVRARRRKNMQGRNSGAVDENAEDIADIEHAGMRSFKYEMDDLIAATDNFSLANRLGVGGFGTVYKGKMTNGDEIAVKKFTRSSMQGTEEFVNEVRFLLKMRHRNLVQLYGWCVHGEERMLIYEYLPNKSLDYFLFDKSKSALLDWPKRWKIIYGLARGLLYLHEDSQLKIIHRDIKAGNILLDDQMNPKISDFGLAKLFQDDQSSLRTRRIAGTFGYMAPEYANRGCVSTKSDIYSFGVLALEIVSGRRNYDPQLDEDKRELRDFTRRLEQQGRLMELVDVNIGSFPQDVVIRCIRVALLCSQKSMRDRPEMYSVLMMLSNESMTIATAGRHGNQSHGEDTAAPHPTGNNVDDPPNHKISADNSITMTVPRGR